jgi:hypothetical protein
VTTINAQERRKSMTTTKSARKSIALLLSLLLIVSLFSGLTIGAGAASTVWDGTIAGAYAGGNGTAASPYQIANGAQLAFLAQMVNAGKTSSAEYYILTDDIYLNYSDTPSVNVWTEIGTESSPFLSSFNGNGHLVCLVYYYAPNTSSATHKGLFGSTASSALIQNLGVTGTVAAYNYAAGIAGYNGGTIQNCFSAVSVTGNDSGTRGSGGITGMNGGSVINCYNIGTVNSLYRPVGGIAGIADTAPTTPPSIQTSYSVGTVTSAGGTGYAGAILATLNSSTVSQCKYLDTSAAHAVAYPESFDGETSSDDMKTSTFPATISSAFAFDSYGVNGGYPILSWETYTTRPVPPNSGGGTYTVSFNTTGVASISNIVTTSGAVSFTITPTVSGEVYQSVTVPVSSGATTAKTATNSYTISNITSNLTVNVVASATPSFSASGISGIVEVLTSSNFTVTGGSTVSQNLLINATAQSSNITINNLQILNGLTSIIDFAGTGNTLTFGGTNVLQEGSSNYAAIHVPASASLAIGGAASGINNLYLYKDSLAAGIGGNSAEVNGALTFNSGNYFLKGSSTGAVIGTGGSAPSVAGTITINGGQLNVATISGGAGIGGGMGVSGGTVNLNGGNLSLNATWTGHALGSGAGGADGGFLFISGGSLVFPDATSGNPGTDAKISDASTNPVAPVTFNLANTAFEFGTFAITIGGAPFFSGEVDHYFYATTTSSVQANWTYIPPNGETAKYNSALTLYLPTGSSPINVTVSNSNGSAGVEFGYNASTGWEYNVTSSSSSVSYLNTGSTATFANGTAWYPYNTLAAAIGNANPNVYILDTVGIGKTDTIASKTFTRAPGYPGDLFSIKGDSSLTITGGTIDGNAANSPVVLGSLINIGGGSLTMSGGTLQNNTTSGNGGAVYVSSLSGSVFNLNGGTITGNSAVLGQGVYADGSSTTTYPIVINPSTSSVITVGTSDWIYLNGTGTRFDLLTSVSATQIPNPLRIKVSNPSTNLVVVRTPDNTTATASVGRFRRTNSTGYSMAVSGANIIYNGTSFE